MTESINSGKYLSKEKNNAQIHSSIKTWIQRQFYN